MDRNAAPASKRVTLRDIARSLDLSQATVSRALNATSDPFITDATRARVRKAAQELGYRPNHAARSLATGKTGLVALWLWSMRAQGSYHAAVAQRMHEAAALRRYQLLLDMIAPGPEQEDRHREFDRWNVDGIIAHEAAPALEGQLFEVTRPPVPLVATGAYNFLSGVDQVRVDLTEGSYDAVRHLLDTGRRKLLYITDDLSDRAGDARYIAFTELVSAAGFEPFYLDIVGTRAQARQAIKRYIELHGLPDALFCHNDDFAIGAYRGLCELGIRVPDDVAIVGFDGLEDGEYLEVQLTTVVQPLEEMCRLAMLFLEERIVNPSAPLQEATVKAQLLVRDSTGPAR